MGSGVPFEAPPPRALLPLLCFLDQFCLWSVVTGSRAAVHSLDCRAESVVRRGQLAVVGAAVCTPVPRAPLPCGSSGLSAALLRAGPPLEESEVWAAAYLALAFL